MFCIRSRKYFYRICIKAFILTIPTLGYFLLKAFLHHLVSMSLNTIMHEHFEAVDIYVELKLFLQQLTYFSPFMSVVRMNNISPRIIWLGVVSQLGNVCYSS